MPLAEMSVDRTDVNAFWDQQSRDLELPRDGSLSNCVFCFLKGVANLRSVYRQMDRDRQMTVKEFGPIAGSPSDLDWWKMIEKKYGRDLRAENRETNGKSPTDFIGFFGASSDFSYKRLAENKPEDEERYGKALLPCDCTE